MLLERERMCEELFFIINIAQTDLDEEAHNISIVYNVFVGRICARSRCGGEFQCGGNESWSVFELEFRERRTVFAFSVVAFGAQQSKRRLRMDRLSGNGGRVVFFDAVVEISSVLCRRGTGLE